MIENTVRISLGNIGKTSRHIHGGMECLLVVKGDLEVDVNGTVYRLNQDDIIVINDSQVHSIEGNEDNIVLRLKIGREYLEEECNELLIYTVICNSSVAEESEKKKYFELKRLLTRLLVIYSEKRRGYRLEFKAIFYLFMNQLLNHFQMEERGLVIIPKKTKDKDIDEILKYINANYDKTLSLEEMAVQFHMSAQYFSKYFKRKMQVGFLEYVTKVRMEYALKDLMYSDHSILRIAMNNGFANVKSFTNAFKKEYQDTPSNYRSLHKTEIIEKETEKKGHEFDIELEDGVIEFLKYMHQHNLEGDNQRKEVVDYEVDILTRRKTQFKKPIKIINTETMKAMLKAEVMSQLKCAQQGLDFQYVYFMILTTREEFCYKRGDMFDFYEFFKVARQLYEYGLTPLIGLDYSLIKRNMPWDSINKFYDYFGRIWQTLFQKLPGNYMKKWKIELQYSQVEDQPEFFCFYQKIHLILRPYLDRNEIGILTMKHNRGQQQANTRTFLKEAKSYNIEPGFISFYAYPEEDLSNLFSYNYKDVGGYYSQLVAELKEICREADIADIEIYMTKWNTLSGKSMAETGTFFRSALILDAILRIWQEVNGIGFHLNTYEPAPLGEKVDTSILALYLYYTIKRPVYFVLEVLNRLGEEIIYRKEDVIVTKNKEDEFVVVVFHPCYVNPAYSVDPAYVSDSNHRVEVCLTGLVEGNYQIKTLIYDKESAGIFNRWGNAGFPNFMDTDIIDYLENAVVPDIMLVERNIRGRCRLRTKLTFNGVVLFTVKKI